MNVVPFIGRLATIEHGVNLRQILPVIDYLPMNLDPCVGFKWHLLCPDDQLRRGTALPEEASRCRSALKTEHPLPVPHASDVHAVAYAVDLATGEVAIDYFSSNYLFSKPGKVVPPEINFEPDQFQVRSNQ